MARLGRRFVKNIVLSSVLVGASIGSVVALRENFQQGLIAGTLAMLGWGALMIITIAPLSLFATRKLTDEQSQPEQTLELKVAMSLPSVSGLIKKALSNLSFVHSIAVNEEEGTITAKTRMSLVSFGEKITIKATKEEQESVLVKISSKPVVKFTAIDYGKNYKNIEALCSMLKSLGVEFIEVSHKSDNQKLPPIQPHRPDNQSGGPHL